MLVPPIAVSRRWSADGRYGGRFSRAVPRSVPGLLGGYGLDLTAELSVALTVLWHMVDTSTAGMTMDGTLPVTCAGR